MLQKLVNSPILLALTASLIYGLGGPAIKQSLKSGTSLNGLLFAIGFGAIILSVALTPRNPIAFANGQSLVASLGLGVMLALAFVCITRAYSCSNGLITIVAGLAATYPLIGSSIELTMMGQAKHVHLPYAIGGAVLVVFGGFLLSICIKQT